MGYIQRVKLYTAGSNSMEGEPCKCHVLILHPYVWKYECGVSDQCYTVENGSHLTNESLANKKIISERGGGEHLREDQSYPC